MISLKKSLDDFTELGNLFRASLKCYLSALESLEEHPVEVDAELSSKHRGRLKQIRQQVSGEPSVGVLEHSRPALRAELRRYSRQANGCYQLKQTEVRRILSLMADAAGTLAERSDVHSVEFRKIANELESVSESDNLSLVRRRLAQSVQRLKNYAEAVRQEEQAAVVRLQDQLRVFRRRIEEAETLAATDPLTGLATRREAERLMAANIEAAQPFCAMLFDLDGFKAVNDRYGHQAGDQVLRLFARKLSEQFRPNDVVCRWGGDEFLTIVNTLPRDAMERAGLVAEKIRGPYLVRSGSETLKIRVSTSVGVAQHEPGETSEQLFACADAFLYQNKGALAAR